MLSSKVILWLKSYGRIIRGKQLLGSQRFRCAVSILNYFLIEVFSFPLSLVVHFEDEMF